MAKERPPAEADEDEAPLPEHEAQDAQRRTGVRPHVVHEAIRREGTHELRRPARGLAWSALAAGLSMGFSLAGAGLLRARLPHASWSPLITQLGYTLGFIFVIGARQQLFTEETVLAVIPFLARPNRKTFGQLARVWSVVLVGNLVGTLLFATVVAHVPVFDDATRSAFDEIAREAMSGRPLAIFVRAIFAGWIIALMVWIMPVAAHSRVAIIIIMTYVVGLAGLSHVIAGAAETLLLVVQRQLSVARWFLDWLAPTLSGNVVGGVALVAALNHAQVVAGAADD